MRHIEKLFNVLSVKERRQEHFQRKMAPSKCNRKV